MRWDWGAADGDTTGRGDVLVKEEGEIQRFHLSGAVGQVWAVSLNQCTHNNLNKAHLYQRKRDEPGHAHVTCSIFSVSLKVTDLKT